jgi:hypothetical protein
VSYQSPIGPIPVIGDFFVNPALPYPFSYSAGSSGVTGNSVSNVYFLRMDEQGMQMVDLVPVGRTELAEHLGQYKFAVSVNPVKWEYRGNLSSLTLA